MADCHVIVSDPELRSRLSEHNLNVKTGRGQTVLTQGQLQTQCVSFNTAHNTYTHKQQF